jgi:hypothetical protein
MHLPGCMVVVVTSGWNSVNSGVLLQSTTSTSKLISELSGIGSPPSGGQVKAFPQAKNDGQWRVALDPFWSYSIPRSKHLRTSALPTEYLTGNPSCSWRVSVTTLPSMREPT